LLRLALLLVGDPRYATHEIAIGYLGDPVEDLDGLDEAQELIPRLNDPALRDRLTQEATEFREVIEHWLAFRRSGAEDFTQWCKEQDFTNRWIPQD